MTENSLPETEGVEYRIVRDFSAYAVGDDGSVWSRGRRGVGLNSKRIGDWKELKGGVHTFGYPQVGLWKNGTGLIRPVHILVLTAFVGPKPVGYETRHLNGDPKDNRLANLCWGTRKENGQDRARHGSFVGVKNAAAKLTEDEVRCIRERYEQREGLAAIAVDYSVTRQTIFQIVNRQTWSHVS